MKKKQNKTTTRVINSLDMKIYNVCTISLNSFNTYVIHDIIHYGKSTELVCFETKQNL